jgi:hypothetical protein
MAPRARRTLSAPHNKTLQTDEPFALLVATFAALDPPPFGLRKGRLVRPRSGRCTLARPF